MQDIIIVGAGGLGREVAWLLSRTKKFNIIGYVDDNKLIEVNNYKYLGTVSDLKETRKKVELVIAIANPKVKEKIFKFLKTNKNFSFPNIVDPTALVGDRVEIGIGNIICANCVLSVDIKIGDFNLINQNSTVGHDVYLESFNSICPSVNLSGYVRLEGNIEIGTGSQIIPNVRIEKNVTLGAGSVVINDIAKDAVAVGVPAKVKKIKE